MRQAVQIPATECALVRHKSLYRFEVWANRHPSSLSSVYPSQRRRATHCSRSPEWCAKDLLEGCAIPAWSVFSLHTWLHLTFSIVPVTLASGQKHMYASLIGDTQVGIAEVGVPAMRRPAANFGELAADPAAQLHPLSIDPRQFSLPNVDERVIKGLPNRVPRSVNVPQHCDELPCAGGDPTQPQPAAPLHTTVPPQRKTLCPEMCGCPSEFIHLFLTLTVAHVMRPAPLSYTTVSDPKTFENLMRIFAFDTSVLDQYRTITRTSTYFSTNQYLLIDRFHQSVERFWRWLICMVKFLPQAQRGN